MNMNGLTLLLVVSCLGSGPVRPQGPIVPQVDGMIDVPMFKDPKLDDLPPAKHFYKTEAIPLWERALERPEVEIRLRAIDAFTRARLDGMPGVQHIVPKLLELLNQDPHRLVRLQAASALVAFDANSAARQLLERPDQEVGPDRMAMILATDSALAHWKVDTGSEVWRQRMDNPGELRQIRISAMESLGQVGDEKALESLCAIATDDRLDLAMRLGAARAAAQIADSGLVDVAQSLWTPRWIDCLIAVSLLRNHKSSTAEGLLLGIARVNNQNPAVTAAALQTLNLSNVSVVNTDPERWLEHDDPNVRFAATEAVVALEDAEAILWLETRLDDPDLKTRDLARRTLLAYDTQMVLRTEVRNAVTRALSENRWRALEQASLIAGSLGFESAADRLVQLLVHDRPEVRLAALAALRRLAIEWTLPSLYQRAEWITERALYLEPFWKSTGGYKKMLLGEPKDVLPGRTIELISEDRMKQLRENSILKLSKNEIAAIKGQVDAEWVSLVYETVQVMTALGQMDYQEAIPLMKRYIPKHSGFDFLSRASAFYALGKLHDGRFDQQLANDFIGRLSDTNQVDPEDPHVRCFSAIGLGRMGKADERVLETLQMFYEWEPPQPDIAGGSRWALIKLTGQELPGLPAPVVNHLGSFLEPIAILDNDADQTD